MHFDSSFDPEKTPGIGQLILVSMNMSEDLLRERDEIFADVDGLSRVYCAIHSELVDAYRIWSIYGRPYTSNFTLMNSEEREERIDLLALWTEVLTLRTVRLTDKSKLSVSVIQFLNLNLDPDLKKEVKGLIEIAQDKTEPLRTARNKFIGHKDFDVVDGKINIQEPGYTIHDIADILESIGNILMCIYTYYAKENAHISFQLGYSPDRKIKY
ncbi:MAG: hypothetical protein OXU51_15665 [Candidatus Poribacteria bacterium]|nr:hypothetical protein [Candidatus Poribacteria bacterium]